MARPLLAALVLAATLASLVPPLASEATTCESARRGHHQYRQPVGVRRMVVDATGAGDFLSIQQAVDSVPVNNSVRVIMQINAGTYIEKVVVPASKPYITLEGAGRDVTVVEWHDKASDRGPDGQQLRTYNTASVTVLSNYFTAKNISFKVSHQWSMNVRSVTRVTRHKQMRLRAPCPCAACINAYRLGSALCCAGGADKVTKASGSQVTHHTSRKRAPLSLCIPPCSF
ncbi:hypothetical protein VPH35_030755 [Triticum aestivum]